jgi:hypothetical protein
MRIDVLNRERTKVARDYHKHQKVQDLERLCDIDEELEKLRHELSHPVHTPRPAMEVSDD